MCNMMLYVVHSSQQEPPRWQAFSYWLLNIIEQNRPFESFQRVLQNLSESLSYFLFTQWKETASQDQLGRLVEMIMEHLNLDKLPEGPQRTCKHPPALKIRGLLWRK